MSAIPKSEPLTYLNSLRIWITGISVLLWMKDAWCAPVTFNTALPVAKGEFVFREQFIVSRSGHDPSPAGRDRIAWSAVSLLGYGVTNKLAVFGVLPYVNTNLDLMVSGQRRNQNAGGLGDISLFARYTLYQRDWPGRTLRVAPFAGFKAPTGKDSEMDSFGRLPPGVQPGSGSWDTFGGLVATYQTLDFEIDGQISYLGNGKTDRFQAGDEARLDLSLQYRLWPRILTAGVPGFWYGLIESNLVYQEKNRIVGKIDPDSGGIRWYLTPGLQYITKRWVVEVAVQLPVVQDLNGSALENSYIVRAGIQVNF
ncbi:MAG: transporter [Methylococcaceae bacterium]|nr:transporter [Methylococcaceae bacterium]